MGVYIITHKSKYRDMIKDAITDKGDYSPYLSGGEKSDADGKKFVFEAPALTRWIVALVIGTIYTLIFIYYCIICVFTLKYTDTYRAFCFYVVWVGVMISLLNAIVIAKSIRELRFTKRYRIFYTMLRKKSVVLLANMEIITKIKRPIINHDLQKAIKDCLIPQGHFASDKNLFMVSDALYEQYSKHQDYYDRFLHDRVEMGSEVSGKQENDA